MRGLFVAMGFSRGRVENDLFRSQQHLDGELGRRQVRGLPQSRTQRGNQSAARGALVDQTQHPSSDGASRRPHVVLDGSGGGKLAPVSTPTSDARLRNWMVQPSSTPKALLCCGWLIESCRARMPTGRAERSPTTGRCAMPARLFRLPWLSRRARAIRTPDRSGAACRPRAAQARAQRRAAEDWVVRWRH